MLPPKRILYTFSKLIMFFFIASTFDAKSPSKAHYDLEVEIKEHFASFLQTNTLKSLR